MARVTGIGGVFFKATGDRDKLSAWYQKFLGISVEDFGGAILQWSADQANDDGITVWHIADRETDWFKPSESSFMINYRIDDMDGMIAQLKDAGVALLQGPESHENGKFAWIQDPDGNKIELWEPMAWDDANKGLG